MSTTRAKVTKPKEKAPKEKQKTTKPHKRASAKKEEALKEALSVDAGASPGAFPQLSTAKNQQDSIDAEMDDENLDLFLVSLYPQTDVFTLTL